jgi:L-lactate dehydrogenase complex protein LldE
MDSNVQVMTGADMSCLMHMQGIMNRDKNPIKVMHISEILLGEAL